MKFKLERDSYQLFITVPEVKQYIDEVTEIDKIVEFKIKKEDIREAQLLINDEIVLHGMDNQDTVNELGLKLYKLYDEILYQKNNQ